MAKLLANGKTFTVKVVAWKAFRWRVWRVLGMTLLLQAGFRIEAATPQEQASGPPVTGGGQEVAMLKSDGLQVFRDQSRKLTIQEALRLPAQEWRPVASATPSFGFTRDVLWLRFRLRREGAAVQQAVVELDTARVEKLDWFVIREGVVTQTELAGNQRSPKGVRMRTRVPTVSVEVRPSEDVMVYVRAESRTAMLLPLKVYSSYEAFIFALLKRDLLGFAFGGLALTVCALGLIQGLIMRSRLHLLAALCAGLLALYFSLNNGYWWWLGLPFAGPLVLNPILSVAQLMLFAAGRFTWEFCRESVTTRWLHRLVKGGLAAVFLTSLVQLLLPFQRAMAILGISCFGVLLSCVIATARQYLFHRRAGGGLLLAGWLLDFIIAVILFFQWYGRFPVVLPPYLGQLVFFAVSSVMFVSASTMRLQQALEGQVQAHKLEQALTEARFRLLRQQVNPHFLFNALNSAIGLTRRDGKLGSAFIMRLAEFLRASLREDNALTVTLDEEMKGLAAYVEIEKVRFEDLLQIHIAIPEELHDWQVLELILQPLVENAVKHGMRPAPFVLRIRVTAARERDLLCLEVANSGSLKAPDPTRGEPGLGIRNLRERLELVYRGMASLALTEENGWVVARMRLPASPARIIASPGAFVSDRWEP